MHLLDTPGVLPPRIETVETGMKLALCGNFTVEIIALPPGNIDVMLLFLPTFLTKIFLHHVSVKDPFVFALLQELFWTI